MAVSMMSVNRLIVRGLILRRKLLNESLCARGFTDNTIYEDCDFFGIPEDYSLEHYRHAKPIDLRKVREGFSNPQNYKHVSEKKEIDLVENYHTKRHSIRKRLSKRSSTQDLPSFHEKTVSGQEMFANERCQSDQIDFSPPSRGKNVSSEFHSDSFIEQVEEASRRPTSESASDFFDDQYFEALSSRDRFQENSSIPSFISDDRERETSWQLNESSENAVGSEKVTTKVNNACESTKNLNYKKDHSELNLFDDYYFGEALSKHDASSEMKPGEVECESDFNAIDDEYFGRGASRVSSVSQPTPSPHFSDIVSSYTEREQDVHEFQTNYNTLNDSTTRSNPVMTNKKMLFGKSHDSFERKSNNNPSANRNVNEPNRAIDVAMKIRQEEKMNAPVKTSPSLNKESSHSDMLKSVLDEGLSRGGGRRDSKGFRILSDQVPNFHKMPSMDIVDMLRNSVVFDHEDFLVIDKPYSLPSIGQQQDTHSLSSLLPALGESLPRKWNASDLHLVSGLDRDVTGLVMLAKNPEVCYMLRAKVKANEVIQRFRAITKGVPSPGSGVIDIPVGLGKVGNIYKMVLRPQRWAGVASTPYDPRPKASQAPCQRAVTNYRVLSSHLEAALVECHLSTDGVKHQLRVHLANALNTPVLGDHKYSHFSKLAPQKLDRSTLELLQVRQAKVRDIPLHLHCHTLVLPDYDARTLVVSSRMPRHFVENMRRLKLFVPRK